MTAGSLDAKRFRYCTSVCGSKCCTLHSEDEGAVTCHRLAEDGSCSDYAERYADGSADLVVVGYYKSRVYKELSGSPALRPFFCGKIENLIRDNALPADVLAGCVYVHPELINLPD